MCNSNFGILLIMYTTLSSLSITVVLIKDHCSGSEAHAFPDGTYMLQWLNNI